MSIIALPIAELKPALIGLGKIIRKSGLPVLNHIKIERTKDGWIAMTATNLEQTATVRLEQSAEGTPISMLIPYDSLQKTVKACSKGDIITVEDEGEAITIHYPIGTQSAQTNVETLKVEDFPSIPRIKGPSISLPDSLRSSIHEAFECASEDPGRYILNGAFIDVSQADCHHVIGTNGRILYSSNSFSLPMGQSLIIPTHPFMGWKEFNVDAGW
jgi:DNA polymerase III sliding clamp (beta) subunit (PCNA family)